MEVYLSAPVVDHLVEGYGVGQVAERHPGVRGGDVEVHRVLGDVVSLVSGVVIASSHWVVHYFISSEFIFYEIN